MENAQTGFGKGFKCETPRETLKTAFKTGWIANEALWLQMLEDRNLTSHTYDETAAMEIYDNIKSYYPEIDRIAKFIREKNPRAQQ